MSATRNFRIDVSLGLMLLGAISLLGLAGCQSSNAESVLPVRGEDYWSMPPAGTKVPAPRGILAGPNDECFVLDNAGRMLVYGPDGKVARQWWMPEYSVGKPEGICVLQDGR